VAVTYGAGLMPLLDAKVAQQIDAYWRGANVLSVGPICLRDNPLLKQLLRSMQVKRASSGH
jgi:xylulose-5-phosphate/fructose-6-phosphate phosphoketolase